MLTLPSVGGGQVSSGDQERERVVLASVLCRTVTCFIGGDGQLIAGFTLADQVFSKHANVVGGGGVEVDDGGLV